MGKNGHLPGGSIVRSSTGMQIFVNFIIEPLKREAVLQSQNINLRTKILHQRLFYKKKKKKERKNIAT